MLKSVCNPGLRGRAGLVLSVCLALAACGERTEDPSGEEAAKRGQTVARVNGEDITIHELEAELRYVTPDAGADREALTRMALQNLVRRTILAREAELQGLHRTADVMLALRRERGRVLAQSFMDRKLANLIPVSEIQVEDFIEQHPHYFEQRRYYVFDQIRIPKDQLSEDIMRSMLDLETLPAVEAALTAKDVEFSRRLNSNVSNQFDRAVADRIRTLPGDGIFYVDTRDEGVVSRIVASSDRPVTGALAREVARRLLTALQEAKARRSALEAAVAGTKVEFFGEFSGLQLLRDGDPVNALEPGDAVPVGAGMPEALETGDLELGADDLAAPDSDLEIGSEELAVPDDVVEIGEGLPAEDDSKADGGAPGDTSGGEPETGSEADGQETPEDSSAASAGGDGTGNEPE